MGLEMWGACWFIFCRLFWSRRACCCKTRLHRTLLRLCPFTHEFLWVGRRAGLLWGIIKTCQAVQTLDFQGDFSFHPESKVWYLPKWQRGCWQFRKVDTQPTERLRGSWHRRHQSSHWHSRRGLQRSNQKPQESCFSLCFRSRPFLWHWHPGCLGLT